MQTLTIQQLYTLLKTRKGAFPVTLKTLTNPAVKAECPVSQLSKTTVVNGMGNFLYEVSVNRQRIREDSQPDFSAFPRVWGVRMTGTPLVEYKGQLYLELKVQRKLEERYFSAGQPIGLDAIEPYLRKKNEGERQGVNAPVVLRDYRLDHILAMRLGGEEYQVVKNIPVGLDSHLPSE